MIIISKKRIIILSSILFVTLFVCSISLNAKNDINLKNTVQTVALPVTNKVIVIDARTWGSR